ncbi:MAG: hypothetical protein IM504_00975 [Microcystis sp. M038S2]|jgi:3D (Asp-Asp-Asp) domain-containing protein|uniref:3D domain-containing protein n=1 Tax=Microcystis aeruginosa SPC777 TaxID=482300 RepID=S3J7V7_MICAE|nr:MULTISPECIES: 3D domain-containing protein [Microcystis]NCR96420.1 hypothetical protein [Microcystis aeruginosa L311-01]OCY13243.1 MAG: hypothetical protein BEV12_06270 [Microcystis aeruginosa CACIAM 03]TRU13012.1 MAG: hypothetical protein EWV58_15455 [Microcystis aeruginosa Ma_MB_F_20061100_S19]TRU16604.1 MAG: hypothetical protein EWV59_01615 [Microcystis aeruginosa Ma_MB_F_20061100_S19D]EPF21270.1 hypothetical protein MAESPC_02886 [Microcystis aeruginosa SPC777]
MNKYLQHLLLIIAGIYLVIMSSFVSPAFAQVSYTSPSQKDKFVPVLIALTESQIIFDFPEPTEGVKDKKLTLFSTFYFVHQAQSSSATDAIALKNSSGTSLGVKLSKKDWCTAALEGTVQVKTDSNTLKTFNFATTGTTAQTNCKPFFPSLKEAIIRAMNRSLFAPAKGFFGDGSGGFILVPYRTIAVDKTVIPLGTVIYIPDARGKEVILPSGKKVKHDGYFFAADVGSAIKGNKIDTFLGITNKNPFSHVKSDPSKTFTAFVITDTRIKSALNTLHKS